ncbi:hypothetical protein HOY82DRAFT_673943 [Tuber indicum]|nr:hypothetical protein HOY82DRAFT_673943 [Tuber indicum]
MLGILLVEVSPLRVQERVSNHIVSRRNSPLEAGIYDIYCKAAIRVTDEPRIPRSISHTICDDEDRFHQEIRNRDWKCVFSGIINLEINIRANNWSGFEVAHVFPLEHRGLGIQNNHERYIAGINDSLASAKIDSSQNGILLDVTIRQKFDQYLVSVNPDDKYKIVVFEPDNRGLDGRTLDIWHFRQSVLANLRGAGEPIFDDDFPLGTDMVGQTPAGSYAQARFESERAARLNEAS